MAIMHHNEEMVAGIDSLLPFIKREIKLMRVEPSYLLPSRQQMKWVNIFGGQVNCVIKGNFDQDVKLKGKIDC